MKTSTLLPQTTTSVNTVTGSVVPASSFYLSTEKLQTLALSCTNVTASILVEATLATVPTDTDWFSVYIFSPNEYTNDISVNLPGKYMNLRASVSDFTHGVINFIKVSYK